MVEFSNFKNTEYGFKNLFHLERKIKSKNIQTDKTAMHVRKGWASNIK